MENITLDQVYGQTEGVQIDYKEVKDNTDELVKSMSFVSNYLNGKKFLVGESLSIADILLVSLLERFFRYLFSVKQRKQLSHLSNFIRDKINSDPFKSFMIKLEYSKDEFPHLQIDLIEEKK